MGQISIFDGSQPLKITKPIRLIELFGGIGSQAAALRNLGANFEHYRLCEFDKYAVKSYNAVHGTKFTTSDIRDLHAEDLGIVETGKYTYIMTYSFPCTDLSLAGKREGMQKGSGTRSGLLWEVERLLTECKNRGGHLPQILLMENVPQVHGTGNKEDFDDWCNFLLQIGYNNKWCDLNAKNFGVPQNRERTFMVSWLGDYYFDFPTGWKLENRLRDLLEDKVDDKYYLSEDTIRILIEHKKRMEDRGNGFGWKPTVGDSVAQTVKTESGYRPDSNFIAQPLAYDEQNCQVRQDGTVGTLTTDGSSPKHNNRVLEPLDCEVLFSLSGGKWDNTYEQSRRVYGSNGVCPTLHTMGGGNQEIKIACKCKDLYETAKALYPNRGIWEHDGVLYWVRKLTPRECWRLMAFTDEDFDKAREVNSDTQLYKQAGNSIVVNVLMEIFRRML